MQALHRGDAEHPLAECEEADHAALDGCSVVTATYGADGRVLGTVGVIGPTRMAYDRIIPVVQATAGLLGDALNRVTATL